MTRLNLILMGILMLCAVGVITSQHKARQLYAELQLTQEAAKQMEIEFGQLQLEQSTWAMHARIEKIAGDRLHMKVPEPSRIHILAPNAPQMSPAPRTEAKS